MPGDIYIVILKENHPVFELAVSREIQDFLNHIFARGVGGMGFAGEYKLDRPFGIREYLHQPFLVFEKQRRAFVMRETPGEDNRQITPD